MDALRLIKTTRHALAEARNVPDALLEAWQAGLLTEAVGSRLAERGGGEQAALGQLLAEAGAQLASCLEPSPESAAAVDWGGSGRASRLTDLGELDPLLEELGRLLHDATDTLVVLACGADAESLYWTCIDGVDAGAECKDLIAELHRAVDGGPAAREPEAGPAGGRPRATGGPDTAGGPGPGTTPAGAGASAGQGPGDHRPVSGDARVPRRCERAPGGAGPDCADGAAPACGKGRAGGAAAGGGGRCAVLPTALPAPASAPVPAPAVPGPAEEHLPAGGTPVLVVPLSAPSAARG